MSSTSAKQFKVAQPVLFLLFDSLMERKGLFHSLSFGASVVIWMSGPANWLLGPRLWWRSRENACKIPMEQCRGRDGVVGGEGWCI